eukprot:CAMPEP_0177642296 /NCGR_PEP_ID=MMETSP0447-20121125/7509_1 /TAXON_ID=0 /ORGANISM="Stygamoeba regulata, Strain BSH-02190019" /LENGTH=496 /DNA_ID=CAMNT_0019144441 /DNA_START=182 /DNA_END=1672 /DNA_ORIENTATION=+
MRIGRGDTQLRLPPTWQIVFYILTVVGFISYNLYERTILSRQYVKEIGTLKRQNEEHFQSTVKKMEMVNAQLQQRINSEYAPKDASNVKIYVYDLPPDMNFDLVTMQDKQDKFAAEILLHQYLLTSPARTTDPEEADLFYVPVYYTCKVMATIAYGSYFQQPDLLVHRALQYIREFYPYWDRTQGKDHVWMFLHDYGACMSFEWDVETPPPFLRNSIIISLIGDLRHKIPCYSPFKDIVIPPYVYSLPLFDTSKEYYEAWFKKPRSIQVYFRGQATPTWGENYSHGVRKQIIQLYADDPMFFLNSTDTESAAFLDEMSNSVFCICPLGFALWSPRVAQSVALGCIPIIIADYIVLPFEQYTDYRKFSIKLRESQVPQLKQIVTSISQAQIDDMRRELARVFKRFVYYRPELHVPGDAYEYILHELGARVPKYPDLSFDHFQPESTSKFHNQTQKKSTALYDPHKELVVDPSMVGAALHGNRNRDSRPDPFAQPAQF